MSSEMSSENTLRTLKDLRLKHLQDHVRVEDIKAEAVKWVKECEKHIGYNIECKNAEFDAHIKCDACERFIDFFNITKENII